MWERILQLSQYRFPLAVWCVLLHFLVFYRGLVVKTTNLEAQTCMDTVV